MCVLFECLDFLWIMAVPVANWDLCVVFGSMLFNVWNVMPTQESVEKL